ncbi:MAG: hypothetical protein QOH08_634 [Chloroflexota bacterium]|jgi:hypothetical protein|nr:hypothetical protein [Chloroflexota bacterium]
MALGGWRRQQLEMATQITVLLTSGRSVTGTFDHGEERLSDALNGSLASVLRIANATLGRFGNPAANEPVAVAIVPKNQAALVIARDTERRTNDKRMYSYVPKTTSELLVLLAGLRIRGRAHTSAPLDDVELRRQLSEARDRFIVLTDAWLAFDVEGTTERPVGVVMLNVRHIQFVATLPSVATETDGPAPAVAVPTA